MQPDKQTPLALHACAHGRYTCYVTGPKELHPKKRRWRKYFDTKAGAGEVLANLQPQPVEVPQSVKAQVILADQKLKVYGKTVQDAFDFYLDHLARVEKCQTIPVLSAKFLTDAKQNHKSAGYVYNLRSDLKKFEEGFHDAKLPEITGLQIETWAMSLDVAPNTRNSVIRTLRKYFKFAQLHGYVGSNPIQILTNPAGIGGASVQSPVTE